jgi:hypothetical protein
MGETVPGGGPENPAGFFENEVLREEVVKKMLVAEGVSPYGVGDFPALTGLRPDKKLAQRVLQIIHRQGYRGDRPWAFKDAKLSLLWPVWKKAFPDARWIIVRRPRQEIIQSCLRTNFMRYHSDDPEFWSQWIDVYRERLEMLKASGVWWREINTPDLMAGDSTVMQSVVSELGLQWQDEQIRRFINPRFWHSAGESGHD